MAKLKPIYQPLLVGELTQLPSLAQQVPDQCREKDFRP
jgi:hypothetical protein